MGAEKQQAARLRALLHLAREFIRAHYMRPVALDDLATVTGLSRFHLVRAFSKTYGLPPHAYQVRLRVEKARQMIAEGVAPAVAAAEVGFADQSHFTRHFKKIHGCTPRQYASRLKKP